MSFPSCHVPDLGGAVPAGRDDPLPVRGERRAGQRCTMRIEGEQLSAGGSVPNLHHLVLTGGDDPGGHLGKKRRLRAFPDDRGRCAVLNGPEAAQTSQTRVRGKSLFPPTRFRAPRCSVSEVCCARFMFAM